MSREKLGDVVENSRKSYHSAVGGEDADPGQIR
jgi:hypothetical protein